VNCSWSMVQIPHGQTSSSLIDILFGRRLFFLISYLLKES
jgi:hypothetical protein